MNESPAAVSGSRPELPTGLADAVERVAAGVVGLATRRRGLAAGVIWRPGLVLTTVTAIGRTDKVQVIQADAQAVVGEVRGVDLATDLALITVPTPELASVERHSTPPLRVGDVVFAVGRDASGQVHASFGHIGATGGAWRTWRGGQVDRLLRLDGGLYAGLVGAAVADARGQLIGIASPAHSRQHGVVLPVASLERIAGQLVDHGRVMRGYIGIAAQPVALSPAMQSVAANATTALLVAGIGDASPAARAGLLVGDIIVSANERAVADVETLRELLDAERIGTRLHLHLLRGGQPMELGIDIAEHHRAGTC